MLNIQINTYILYCDYIFTLFNMFSVSSCPALPITSVVSQSPAPTSCPACTPPSGYLPVCLGTPAELQLPAVRLLVGLDLLFETGVALSEVTGGVFEYQPAGRTQWTTFQVNVQQVL